MFLQGVSVYSLSRYGKCACPSVRPSVCPYVCHTLLKTTQARIMKSLVSAAQTSAFRIRKAFQEIPDGSSRSRAVNKREMGKICDFQRINRRISETETVLDRAKITIIRYEVSYALSIPTKINYLG